MIRNIFESQDPFHMWKLFIFRHIAADLQRAIRFGKRKCTFDLTIFVYDLTPLKRPVFHKSG